MDERENREKRGSWIRQLKRSAADDRCEVKIKAKRKNKFYNAPVENNTNASNFKLSKPLIPISNLKNILENEDVAQDISNLYSYALQDHSPDPYLPRDVSPTILCDLNFQHLENIQTTISSATSPPTTFCDDKSSFDELNTLAYHNATALSTSLQAPSKEKPILCLTSPTLPGNITTASCLTSFTVPPEKSPVLCSPNLPIQAEDDATTSGFTCPIAPTDEDSALLDPPPRPDDNATIQSSSSLTTIPTCVTLLAASLEKSPVLCSPNLPIQAEDDATTSGFTCPIAPTDEDSALLDPPPRPDDNATIQSSSSLTTIPTCVTLLAAPLEKSPVLCCPNLPSQGEDDTTTSGSPSIAPTDEVCALLDPPPLPEDNATIQSSSSLTVLPTCAFLVTSPNQKSPVLCCPNLPSQGEDDATTSGSPSIAPTDEVSALLDPPPRPDDNATIQSSSSLTTIPTCVTLLAAPLEKSPVLCGPNLPIQAEDYPTAPSSSSMTVVPEETPTLSSPNLLAKPEEEDCYILDEYSGILHKAYICDICLKMFQYKKNIKKHIRREHQQQKIKKISKKEQSENRKNKKKLRAAGKEYKTLKGRPMPSRIRRTFFCRKCPYKCTTSIEQQQMDSIFNSYWKLGEQNEDQDQQRQYISDHVDIIEPDRRRVKKNSRKQKTYVYYVTLTEQRLKVCRQFFLNVHGITEKFVRMALKKRIDHSGLVRPDCRGRQPAKNKTALEDEQFARNHILSIPAVESHYCRKSTTRKYLPAELNMNKLYDMYKNSCRESDRLPISISVYKKYFYGYNLSFHTPRKDTCNTCQLYESLPDDEKDQKKEEHQKHLRLKDRAREVKNEAVEKEKDNQDYCVLNFDMQAVLESPKGKACAIFYKRKFSTYNLTIYDIISHQGVCNMWTEVEGKRGSIEVATCVYKYIASRLDKHKFYFVSDSCGGQNRNQFFATACVEAVRSLPHVHSIDHIFYEPGHSQQEGDSMHSTIERAAKNITINAPSEWVTICKIARKHPAPYQVHELHHDDFIDFKEVAKNHPIKKGPGSPTISWLSIKWLRYSKAEPNEIQYRYDYDSPFMTMSVATKRTLRGRRVPTELPKAYTERLPITKAKYNDLMSLCKSGAISRNYHYFYEELPHSQD